MKTDKDGEAMRGVTVNRFAEGKNICIETDKVRNFMKIQYLRKYACDSSCKSFNVKIHVFVVNLKVLLNVA